MEIIDSPIRGKKLNLKPFFIILIIIGSSIGIAIPILMYQKQNGSQSGFTFIGFSVKSYDNNSQSVTLNAEFQYKNDIGKKIQITTFEGTFLYKAKNELNWRNLFDVTNKENINVDLTNPVNFTGNFQITNKDSDSLKRFLLGEIIRKGEFTIRIQGKVYITPNEEVGEDFPTYLEMNIIKSGNEQFQYDIPSNGVSTFLLNDIITPGIDPSYPNDYQLIVKAEYKNVFSFPITFDNFNFSLINRTENSNLGDFSFNASFLGLINANSTKNFTTKIFAKPDQLGWVVSDLLSDKTDVIKIINLVGIVKIGEVKIQFNDTKQVLASNLKFELKIVRYGAQGVNLVLDVELVNPSGLVFNLTSIILEMFVTGTIQKIVDINKVGYWPIEAYSKTKVKNLVVDAEYSAFIQHLNDNFDLIGNFQANSFNFDGVITFENTDVDIIT